MPGDSLWIAVEIDLPEGWHTYWRNPVTRGAANARLQSSERGNPWAHSLVQTGDNSIRTAHEHWLQE